MSESRAQVFHVVSRVVDKRLIFMEQEKAFFYALMRNLEAYSGVEILSYCLMGNHFHMLIHVPIKPKEITVEEIRERMKHIYSEKKIKEMDAHIEEMKSHGVKDYEDLFYQKQRARMFNISSYFKELKERFSKWYNARTERTGTLWESRFKSLLVEGEEGALMNIAAYIELNPVRAGLVEEPQEYRWCSYTEAIAGGKKARTGILKLVGGLDNIVTWEKALAQYRTFFIFKATSQNECRKGYSEDYANQELENEGKLSRNKILLTKVRYFTDGLVIGSKKFLEDFANSHKEIVGENRKRFGTKIKGSEIYSYRNVK